MTAVYEKEATKALEELNDKYGSAELDNSDKVLLMDGWNKILGWETMYKEALWFRWRIVVARKSIEGKTKGLGAVEARKLVENNKDPLAVCFGVRRQDAKNVLLALFDSQFRSLCPHLQTVQRESYRPVTEDRGAAFGITLEFDNADDIFRFLATIGVSPGYWLSLCEAFLWTMESHNPYIGDEDVEDLEKPPRECAYARFVADFLARKGIKDGLALREKYAAPIYATILPEFWSWVKKEDDAFGEEFYKNLLSNYPETLDYFARADMDTLAHHIILAFDLMTKYPEQVGQADSSFRSITEHLGEMHRQLGIPTDTYPQIGMNFIQTLENFSSKYPALARLKGVQVTKEELNQAFVDLYSTTMSFTFYPMLLEELMIRKATEFFQQVAEELDWSAGKMSKRLLQVKLEINATGTYQHTSEEIELGARLCWRNSAKCIGRISWNTLMVRDCRHVESPEGIIHEIEKHLELATAGTNLQSVMTVFRPKKPDEPWGMRFWSDQLVRYACYTDEDGNTMGDTANKHLTKYLIDKNLWTPPKNRTQHDVLPVVIKLPGRAEPIVHQFESKWMDEADIFHPDYPEVAKLGHKWAAVPAINNFNMNLGGVDYGCMPFNGWFCSVEIVRDIMERYPGASEKWAAAIGLDIKTHRMWKARVAHEIDVAVLHSFDKAGYTIVDPETVGEQFMVHCKREKDAGRECPAQWSWIGGLTGPTNKTWHKEMRDFRKDPQYEYCCDQYAVTGEDETFDDEINETKRSNSETELDKMAKEDFTIPRVLIAYGSETGTAEAAAGRLGRALHAVKPVVCILNKVAGLEIIKQRNITHMLVLCSTFGAGKPPTSAMDFMNTEIPDELLADTKIATLALGSTMYPDFCQAGKALNKKLTKAGGQPFCPIHFADEAVDSAGSVSQWIKLVKDIVCPSSLEAAIYARMGASSEPVQYAIKWQETDDKGSFKKFNFPEDQSSPVLTNEELLVGGDVSKRSTRRIAFQVPHGSSYVTGDHLAVHPLNSPEVVERFAACFIDEFMEPNKNSDSSIYVKRQLQQQFEVDCNDNGHVYPAILPFSTPATLGEVLQSAISLSLSEASATDVIAVVMDYITFESDDDVIKQFKEIGTLILEGQGDAHQQAMNIFLSLYPTVVGLLEMIVPIIRKHKSKPISLAHLLSILPRLQPRLYSISSCSTVSPDVVEISVGVVHAMTDHGVKIAGVCSNYLALLESGKDRAKIAIRASNFRGPKDLINTPMIMVGAGTGLAPMMGFLNDRANAVKQAGKASFNNTHLFFGCRTHDERIYRDTISKWDDSGIVQLHLGLSRDSVLPKMYVQDLLKENGKMVCDLLMREDCRYFVCGDARMADFCYEAVVEALREYGNMSRSKAINLLKRVRVEDRWQYDLWGISSYMDEGSYSEAKSKIAKRNGNRALTWLSKMKQKTTEDEW